MKITFIKDHQSPLSGNSFYAVGTRADFSNGQGLIDLGVAYAGWGMPETQNIPESVSESASSSIEEKKIDDLTRVRGVGIQTMRALNNIDVYTYGELIDADADKLNNQLDGVLNFITPTKIRRWQKSAKGLV